VRFIHNEQVIFREKIEKSERLRSRLSAGKMPRIVLDAVAESHLLQHLEVVFGPHLQPLRFEQSALRLELHDALVEFVPNRGERAI
jgi:hypothetical protein